MDLNWQVNVNMNQYIYRWIERRFGNESIDGTRLILL